MPCNSPKNLVALVRCYIKYSDLGRFTRLRKEMPSWGPLSFVVGDVPGGVQVVNLIVILKKRY